MPFQQSQPVEIFYLIDRKTALELEKFTFRPGGTRMVEWARMGELRSKPWRRVDLKGSAKQKRAAGAVWAPAAGLDAVEFAERRLGFTPDETQARVLRSEAK